MATSAPEKACTVRIPQKKARNLRDSSYTTRLELASSNQLQTYIEADGNPKSVIWY